MGFYTHRCSNPRNKLKDGMCCCSYCEGYADGLDAADEKLAQARALLREAKTYVDHCEDRVFVLAPRPLAPRIDAYLESEGNDGA